MIKKKNDLVKQKEEIALVEQEYMERDRLRNVRAKRELEEIQEAIDLREENRQQALKKQRSFGEFSDNLKKSFLKETLFSLYENSLPKNQDNSWKKSIGSGLIDSYVEEKGVDGILLKNKYNSLFLSEMNRMIESYHKAIIETVDREDPTFTFDDSYKDEFFDSVKGEDFDEISDTIRLRVADAIEDFVQSNTNNKYDIEEIISNTKDKINNSSYGTPEDVKQEYANIGKRRIEAIKNRKYGLLEAFVQKISKQSIVSESMNEVYSSEDGKLDMNKIVESATAIYTFLEMLNTTKLDTINESYIREFLENMDRMTEEAQKSNSEIAFTEAYWDSKNVRKQCKELKKRINYGERLAKQGDKKEAKKEFDKARVVLKSLQKQANLVDDDSVWDLVVRFLILNGWAIFPVHIIRMVKNNTITTLNRSEAQAACDRLDKQLQKCEIKYM